MPVYRKQKNEFELSDTYEKSDEYLKLVEKNFCEKVEEAEKAEKKGKEKFKKPNFFAVWKINENKKYIHKFEDGPYFYPFVIFALYSELVGSVQNSVPSR
jgi:NH3-dependent NAD+ synthetase